MTDRPFTATRLPDELAALRRLLDELLARLRARGDGGGEGSDHDAAAARPLAHLAAAWPSPLETVGQWERLWEALRDVRGLGPTALSAEERAMHDEALRLVERALRRQMNDDREQHP